MPAGGFNGGSEMVTVFLIPAATTSDSNGDGLRLKRKRDVKGPLEAGGITAKLQK